MLKLEKLNDKKVTPVKVNDRKVEGGDLFAVEYPQVFIVSKKHVGKSQLIYYILQQMATPDSVIILFSSTCDVDPLWEHARKKFAKLDIPFICHSEIKDADGNDQIAQLLELIKSSNGIVPKGTKERAGLLLPLFPSACEKEEVEELPPKQEFICVFDDMGTKMKHSKSLAELSREHRHFHIKLVLASQFLMDLGPGVRAQIDVFIMFKGMQEAKLKQIWQESASDVPFDKFLQMYNTATKIPYNFFYVFAKRSEYRSGFSHKFLLQPANSIAK